METEIGGLLILEEMSLLKTVAVKAESVLLLRNLNNCKQQKSNVRVSKIMETYLDEKMNIEISASSVVLVRVLNSTSFDEINTL